MFALFLLSPKTLRPSAQPRMQDVETISFPLSPHKMFTISKMGHSISITPAKIHSCGSGNTNIQRSGHHEKQNLSNERNHCSFVCRSYNCDRPVWLYERTIPPFRNVQ